MVSYLKNSLKFLYKHAFPYGLEISLLATLFSSKTKGIFTHTHNYWMFVSTLFIIDKTGNNWDVPQQGNRQTVVYSIKLSWVTKKHW